MPRVAVIGAGASGYAATRALDAEKYFDAIRVFERKPYVGGIWAYEPTPDPFTLTPTPAPPIPPSLSTTHSVLTPPAPPSRTIGNASYAHLDTNSGAQTMAFTHTPIPVVNSAASVRRFGANNETRTRAAVQDYLETLFAPLLHLVSFRTHVEKIERLSPDHSAGSSNGDTAKQQAKWRLTLRQEGVRVGERQELRDHWWTEDFDGVVVASGHYTNAQIPAIHGLKETFAAHPDKIIHSKSWRGSADYTNKKVLIVGSSISASDIVEDLHAVVTAPLLVTRRTIKPFLENVFLLPNVQLQPVPVRFTPRAATIDVEFSDGSVHRGIQRVIFATGFAFDYSFLPWPAVTPTNRLSGFYQHIFRIGDPSLAVVGQARAGISLRVFEYQAIAAARFLAGRSQDLPGEDEQRAWEQRVLVQKGDSDRFHEIKPDYAPYYAWLTAFAKPKPGQKEMYAVQEFDEAWVENDQSVLWLKVKYWESLLDDDVRKEVVARREREKAEKAERETAEKEADKKTSNGKADIEKAKLEEGAKDKAEKPCHEDRERPTKKQKHF